MFTQSISVGRRNVLLLTVNIVPDPYSVNSVPDPYSLIADPDPGFDEEKIEVLHIEKPCDLDPVDPLSVGLLDQDL